jgi:ferredoxin
MDSIQTKGTSPTSGDEFSGTQSEAARFLSQERFERLLALLIERGHQLIGPTVRDGAIVYDTIGGVGDLPRGVREIQGPGEYGIEQTGDDRLFAWAHGADSPKRFLFPPRDERNFATRDENGRMSLGPRPLPDVDYAFVGVRSCDLNAIQVQDRVFLLSGSSYRARREGAILIGVNCSQPAATCFCASMGTGPRCSSGFDIALTELEEGFTAEPGTEVGAELLLALEAPEATTEQVWASLGATDTAEQGMKRSLDTTDIRQLMYSNRENPRWDEVAARCLTCTNCTMVCPTCFCFDFVDSVSLDGLTAKRSREWASCFSEEYAHMAFGSVRASARSRYRQWLTHKFASWIDQFDVSGCVGCGRCITWCPVGIDVTEEIQAIRATDGMVAEEALT